MTLYLILIEQPFLACLAVVITAVVMGVKS